MGWQPIGVTLGLDKWQETTRPVKNNPDIARRICRKLQVPYFFQDEQIDFRKSVVKYFINELRNNRTPNPCVICNAQFKFKKLFEFANYHGADFIATGHYAKLKKGKLLIARDKHKDQSYYLAFLKMNWLKKLILPLGDYFKKDIYKLAKLEGFDYFQKSEQSQDFCYLAGVPIAEFIKKELRPNAGRIIDETGKILGRHQGLAFYTIGQRKGIKLGGGPYFVKSFDIIKNNLIVTKDKNRIYQKDVWLSPINFLSDNLPNKPFTVMAKVRYRQPLAPAIIYPPIKQKYKVVFNQSQHIISPGQVCTFYRRDECLGGGIIQ